MKQLIRPILAIEKIAKETFQLDLELELEELEQIKPGQFIHIRVRQGSEFMLRRPISVADVDFEAKKLTVIFKVFGEGTKVFSNLKTVDLVDIMMPLGNPYQTKILKIDIEF